MAARNLAIERGIVGLPHGAFLHVETHFEIAGHRDDVCPIGLKGGARCGGILPHRAIGERGTGGEDERNQGR